MRYSLPAAAGALVLFLLFSKTIDKFPGTLDSALRDSGPADRSIRGRICGGTRVDTSCEFLFPLYAGDTGGGSDYGIWQKVRENGRRSQEQGTLTMGLVKRKEGGHGKAFSFDFNSIEGLI